MVVEHKLVDAVVLFYIQRKIAHLITRLEQNRPSNVALRVGRALDELPKVVLVPRRIANVAPALEYHQLGLLSFEIHSEAVQNPAMNHEVVAFSVLQIPVNALQNPIPLAHVDELVGLRVPIEEFVVRRRLHVKHCDFGIEQERNSVEGRTSTRLYARRQKMAVMKSLVRVRFVRDLLYPSHGLHRGRRMDVIQQRRSSMKPFVPHQLLGVKSAAGLSKSDVSLARNCTERVIVRHSEIPSQCLFAFDRLKQCLEVPRPEALGSFPLDDLVEQRRPVLHRLREYLEEIALLVTVNENPELPQ